jgi:hypothetical protein
MDDGVIDVSAIKATLAFKSQAGTLVVEEFLNHHGSPATCTRHSALLMNRLAWYPRLQDRLHDTYNFR